MGREERRGRRGWDDDDDFGREKRKDRDEGGDEGSSQDNGGGYERNQDEVEGCSQVGGSQEGQQKGDEEEVSWVWLIGCLWRVFANGR